MYQQADINCVINGGKPRESVLLLSVSFRFVLLHKDKIESNFLPGITSTRPDLCKEKERLQHEMAGGWAQFCHKQSPFSGPQCLSQDTC